MKKYKRIFTVVLDSVGIGAAGDAEAFGDAGADTLGHISRQVPGMKIPHLQSLGIANVHRLPHVRAAENTLGYYARLREASNGKDTMTGHWEMMGLHITTPFKTFTETGFPKELIDELSRRTGRVIIGNKSASGTAILDELGEEEIATGHMIVYTSADSVLQICGNEETFGLEELYRCCEIARELTMRDEWKVGRVIARPYVGRKKGEFRRTSNRHDYALKPYGATVLNALKEAGYDVISVGKIADIFDGEGITESNKSKSSVHGMEALDQKYVGFDDEVQPSDQFGTNCLRMGRRLQENFVMTDEPGIYFIPALIDDWKASGHCKEFINFDLLETYKDFGGIRIEDDILITSDGCRFLGKNRIPYHPDEVEQYMAENKEY